MKEKSLTNLHVLMRTSLAFLLSVCCSSFLMAQCQMNCNDNVQVSLNQNCEGILTYDLMLEDPDNPYLCTPNGPSSYTVILMDAHGHPVNEVGEPAIVTCDEIGETRTVKVKHWRSGNFCWGTVTVEDKLPPTIECREIELWCNEDSSLDALGFPNVTDNCDDFPNAVDCGAITVEFVEDIWEDLDCDSDGISAIIRRVFRASDASGNWSYCEEVITLRRFDLCVGVDEHWDCIPNPELELPENTSIDCDSDCGEIFKRICDGTATDADISASYECAGFPSLHDHFLGDQPGQGIYACEINVGVDDTCIEICDGASFKVIRDFRILDWCTGDILEYTQIIKIEDNETDIICPADLTVGTNLGPTACGWFGNIPAATPNENCAGFSIQTKIYGPVLHGHVWLYELIETIDGNGGLPSQPLLITKGCESEYTIRYEITDDCHNHDFCEMTLTVRDDDAPTPVCDEITQVTLDAFPFADDCNVGGGIAIVYAQTFDDGSHDNCTDNDNLLMEVRRMGTSSWRPFVVFDCNDCGDAAMVEFRVTDECGNVSESCMVEVLVDDKTPPVITCPADLVVACTDIADPQNNDQVKAFLDGLGSSVKATAVDNCCVDLIDCTIIENGTNECGVGDIRILYTAFDLGWPSINSSSCVFTLTVEDNTPVVVNFPPDLDLFCDNTGGTGFGGGTDPSDLSSPFDTVNISGADCELVTVNHFDEFHPISDGACFKILRRWVVIDWCSYDPNGPQVPANGYYSHIQVIKVLDNDAPIVTVEDQDICIFDGCAVDVDICRPDVQDCVPADFLSYTYSGDLGTGIIAGECATIPNVAPGTYNITITTFDNCGNATVSEYQIKVEDCKKPSPYCKNGLVVELMPTTGMIQTWASDFDAGSFDNCPGDLQLSFSDDVSDIGRTYTCAELGTQIVRLWVTDAAGNQDFCETFVIVQDNMGACPTQPRPGGFNDDSNQNVKTTDFKLYQNAPNPFNGVTNINFNLAEAGFATLRVHDVTGKVIKMIRGDYAQGLNTISISKAQLNATGVLYYTLETVNHTATRKMIVIK